jgi:hypothetical protein
MMPETPGSVTTIIRAIISAMKNPYTCVLKVTDQTTERIMSSGHWILPKNEGDEKQPREEDERWVDFPEHCDEELANALFGAFAQKRHEMMGHRRHYCELRASDCPVVE